MYTLTIIRPPARGAGYGKATVTSEVVNRSRAADLAIPVLMDHGISSIEAHRFATNEVWDKSWGTDVTHEPTGITFRISDVRYTSNACPCCGRLVEFGDHALAGSDDAYCLGCHTWDRNAAPCLPENTAHHNPWGTATGGARWYLEVIIDRDGETDSDYRYSVDAELLHDDPTDAALIAWPGLSRDQIIEATLTEIHKEN